MYNQLNICMISLFSSLFFIPMDYVSQNNIRTLLGKGSFGAVYKYGNNYVEKEYFNIKNLSEITKEILLFSAFYQRGVYVRFNGSKFNVYFAGLG